MAENEIETKAPGHEDETVPRAVRAPRRAEGVRFASLDSLSSGTAQRIYLAVTAVVAFALGLFASGIYFGYQNSRLTKEKVDLALSLGQSGMETEKCIDALDECVRDFDLLSAKNTVKGMQPVDYRIEQKRKKKEALSEELSARQRQLSERMRRVDSPRKLSDKEWQALRAASAELKQLGADLEVAEKELRAVLLEGVKNPANLTSVDLAERNKKRADFAKNLSTSRRAAAQKGLKNPE